MNFQQSFRALHFAALAFCPLPFSIQLIMRVTVKILNCSLKLFHSTTAQSIVKSLNVQHRNRKLVHVARLASQPQKPGLLQVVFTVNVTSNYLHSVLTPNPVTDI